MSGLSCPSLGPTRGAGVASVDLRPGSMTTNVLRCDELAHDDEWRENLSSSGTVGMVDTRRDDNGVETQEKQVWQLRTLLPDLPGESAVASPDSPALRGHLAQLVAAIVMGGLRRWVRIMMASPCILAFE